MFLRIARLSDFGIEDNDHFTHNGGQGDDGFFAVFDESVVERLELRVIGWSTPI
jgi:hypothetical protein